MYKPVTEVKPINYEGAKDEDEILKCFRLQNKFIHSQLEMIQAAYLILFGNSLEIISKTKVGIFSGFW